jgi:hypothetical protein
LVSPRFFARLGGEDIKKPARRPKKESGVEPPHSKGKRRIAFTQSRIYHRVHSAARAMRLMFGPPDYFTSLDGPLGDLTALAERVFPQVFRSDFSAPGVALLSLGPMVGSTELRSLMVALKEALLDLYFRHTDRHLVYLSMAKFNQQVTTKFHLDGAPEESYLMLGYEPTVVPSRLAVADYTRAARDWGITPETLLADFNPMYADHERRLRPYVTELTAFDPAVAQILLVNNSRMPYVESRRNPLGVMHQATIVTPQPGRNRVVNSIMMGTAAEPVEAVGQRLFLETDAVAGEIV